MKLYLNDKERTIPFLRLLELMLKGAIESGEVNLSTLESIAQADKYVDPVRDFLDYYIEDSGQQDKFDEGRIQWIRNALYAAKGAPQVLEILKESLGIGITYEYSIPVLNVLQFDRLELQDVVLFYKRFSLLLYYLIYYSSFNMMIRELVINVIENLSQSNYIGLKGFINLKSELDSYVISNK